METHPNPTAPVSMEAAPRLDTDLPDVERARAGDLEAFETLVGRYGRRVYRTILGVTGNESDAQDGVQNTFMKVFRHVGEFEGNSKFSSWLMRIALNEGLEILRRRKTRQTESLDSWTKDDEQGTPYPRDVRDWGEDPERRYSRLEMRQLVEQEIMKLPAKYRTAVMLRDLEQMDTQEAATALGLNEATLKTRLLRGRLMLREALAPKFNRPGPERLVPAARRRGAGPPARGTAGGRGREGGRA